MSKGYRGSTRQCLDHWLQEMGSTPAAVERLREASPGIGNARTISDWFAKGVIPVGERLMRLQSFLGREGYHLTELDALSPEIRAVRAAIGKGMAADEAARRIGYRKIGHMYAMLNGEIAPTGDFKKRFEAFAEELLKPPTAPAQGPATSDLKRKAVQHAITLCNSLAYLLAASGMTPEDANDGDRARIADAFKKLGLAFGIDVHCKSGKTKAVPLTVKDLSQLVGEKE